MGLGQSIQGQGCFWRDDYILKFCKDKRVLHVGCTAYPFFREALKGDYLLHEKLSKITNQLVGIDIVKEELEVMRKRGYDARLVDARHMSDHPWNDSFDVILLADVIEHISNPGLVLAEAKKLLREEGKIVISVPNALGIIRFLKSFFRYEQVHPDHVAYYSSGTLGTLAKTLNLDLIETGWYRFEVRDKRFIVYMSAFLERIITAFFPWQAEGCLAVMVPANIKP